jgi:hypothetical protein
VSLTEDEARKIARSIAFGHAYEKHAANVSESGELITRSSFESLILETLLNPDRNRKLKNMRFVFWHAAEGFLVVFNPKDPDFGTAYWPIKGRKEYETLF